MQSFQKRNAAKVISRIVKLIVTVMPINLIILRIRTNSLKTKLHSLQRSPKNNPNSPFHQCNLQSRGYCLYTSGTLELVGWHPHRTWPSVLNPRVSCPGWPRSLLSRSPSACISPGKISWLGIGDTIWWSKIYLARCYRLSWIVLFWINKFWFRFLKTHAIANL